MDISIRCAGEALPILPDPAGGAVFEGPAGVPTFGRHQTGVRVQMPTERIDFPVRNGFVAVACKLENQSPSQSE